MEKKKKTAVWGATADVKPFKVNPGITGRHAVTGIVLVPGAIVEIPENQAGKELFSTSTPQELKKYRASLETKKEEVN